MNIEFKLATRLGTDLSSRHLGAELREEASRVFADGGIAVFNFDSVRSVSDSFADELLATLAEAHGDEWFRQHVRLTNLSKAVRTSILEAVANRLTFSH